MFKFALGIGNWAFEHTELAEMICFSETQKLGCAQFLISKATFIESAINTPRFSARREINFKEALESSLILIPVLL